MVERLSTVQYAEKAGMSKQNVLYHITRNNALGGVIKVEQIAGRNILHTDLKELQRLCKNKSKGK
jgi:DNA-binding CsgD family transcriptional regulator